MTNEQYELLAEQFYKDTGVMAPGKDQPPELYTVDYSERSTRWIKWLADLSESQKMRMMYALEIAGDDLAVCGVNREAAKKELVAITLELLVEMKVNKQQTPNSQTELVWRKRAQNSWRMA
jgi:hypothetical protein